MTDPILLTDEKMREFIVNGYLVFTPTVPEGTHETCYHKLNEGGCSRARVRLHS